MTSARRVHQLPLNVRIAQDIIDRVGITSDRLRRPVQLRDRVGNGFNPEPVIWHEIIRHVTGLRPENKGILIFSSTDLYGESLDLDSVHVGHWLSEQDTALESGNNLAVAVIMATIMELVPQPEMHQMHLDAEGRLSGSPFSWPEFIEAKKAGAGIS